MSKKSHWLKVLKPTLHTAKIETELEVEFDQGDDTQSAGDPKSNQTRGQEEEESDESKSY